MKQPTTRFFVFAYHLMKAVCKILHPTTVEGLENLPESGVLLCPNHASNWDPVLLGINLPVNYRLFAMGKSELFKYKPIAWIMRHLGAFPVNRGGTDIQAVKTAIQILKRGDNLLVFSEGTVIRDGIGHADGLPAHAKSGIAMIGIRTGATMIPVFVDGEKKLFHKTRVIFGEPYTPVYTGRHGTAEEMQKIADDLLAQAYALGGQAVGGKPL